MSAADDIQAQVLEHVDELVELLRDELTAPTTIGDGEVLFGDGFGLVTGSMRERLAEAAESRDQREHLLAAVEVFNSVLTRALEREKYRVGEHGPYPSADDRFALVPALIDITQSLANDLAGDLGP